MLSSYISLDFNVVYNIYLTDRLKLLKLLDFIVIGLLSEKSWTKNLQIWDFGQMSHNKSHVQVCAHHLVWENDSFHCKSVVCDNINLLSFCGLKVSEVNISSLWRLIPKTKKRSRLSVLICHWMSWIYLQLCHLSKYVILYVTALSH